MPVYPNEETCFGTTTTRMKYRNPNTSPMSTDGCTETQDVGDIDFGLIQTIWIKVHLMVKC